MRTHSFGLLALSLLLATSCARPGSNSTWVHVGGGGSIVSSSGDELSVRWRKDGVETLVDVKGELELTEDQRDVRAFLTDGSLRVHTEGEGPDRDLLIEPDGEDQTLRYSVDGVEVPWDDEAADWFAGVLDELVQRSGLGAAAHAERILAEGGPMALAQEIARVEPGEAQNVYVERLLEEPRLSKQVLLVVLDATPRMSSESTRAHIAARCAPHEPSDAELTERLLEVAASISSSSTRVELLETLGNQRELDAALRERAIRVAAGTSSESERGQALVLLAPPTADASVEVAWVNAARSISSSSTKSETLQAFLRREAISPRGLAAVVNAASTISSESARTELLVAWLARAPADTGQRAKWVEAVETISSSSMKAEALTQLLERDDLDKATLDQAAEAITGISSDSTRAELQQLLIVKLAQE